MFKASKQRKSVIGVPKFEKKSETMMMHDIDAAIDAYDKNNNGKFCREEVKEITFFAIGILLSQF
jgi:hypothetical protein